MRGSRCCTVSLPRGEEYDVRLVYDGRPSLRPTSSLSVFGSGKAWSVDNVVLCPGAIETFSVSARKFTYIAGSKQRPTLRVADDTDSRNGYYEVSGFEINEGYEFASDEDANGRTTFNDNDPSIDNFDIKAEAVGDEETRSYDFNDVSVDDDGRALLDTDDDNDGTADSATNNAADASSHADADDSDESAEADSEDPADSGDEEDDGPRVHVSIRKVQPDPDFPTPANANVHPPGRSAFQLAAAANHSCHSTCTGEFQWVRSKLHTVRSPSCCFSPVVANCLRRRSSSIAPAMPQTRQKEPSFPSTWSPGRAPRRTWLP